jgi:arsenite methyltransferase
MADAGKCPHRLPLKRNHQLPHRNRMENRDCFAEQMGLRNVEFREGLIEEMPVEDGWADVVMSNGVINLCADKKRAFEEIWRVLRPGG